MNLSVNSVGVCVVELDYSVYRLLVGLCGVLNKFWGLGMKLG